MHDRAAPESAANFGGVEHFDQWRLRRQRSQLHPPVGRAIAGSH